MAELSTVAAGLRFPNPVLAGSGPLSGSAAGIRALIAGGAGGVVTRTISVLPCPLPPPPVEVRGGTLHLPSWSELSWEQWVERELPEAHEAARAAGVPLIASIGYTAAEVALLAPRVAPFVDGVELATHFLRPGTGAMTDAGAAIDEAHSLPSNFLARDLTPLVAAMRAARTAPDVPLFVKLPPLGGEMSALARQVEAAGADGLVTTDPLGPVMGIDAAKVDFLIATHDGHAWLSGTSLRPLAVRCTFDAARSVKIPVIGAGGVSKDEDAAEYLLAGARAVQLTAAAIKPGPTFYGRLAAKLSAWLDKRNYATADEIVGLGLDRWASLLPHDFTVPVLYDIDDCIGCRLCELSCHYDAIYMVPGANKVGGNEVAEFNADRCFGCGLCVVRCPTDALLMPMLQRDGGYVHPKTGQPTTPGAGSIKAREE